MFNATASVIAPPNPEISWYVALNFSLKTIPVETTDTVILQSVKVKVLRADHKNCYVKWQ